ncbi:rhodanese-like domain-containing protein [Gulosibacter sp. 10]|uniref:rhodanese-like domain-containing protein n=1 Tax=Gulosibacter sp. 10 TaxID=1255570 RepID=UPI00097F2465|nr:rhodanese-like domain-containing protein [Gulosibacter sp. 10]SJM64355.1 Rhodanese-like domain protein [Gulosibacter sp. 10]
MNEITPTQLFSLGTNVQIIDVREPDEVAAVRIPWAKNVPLSEFSERLDEVPVGAYIMCKAGGRSARAVQYLERLGRDATNVSGGMDEWEGAGYPVERD